MSALILKGGALAAAVSRAPHLLRGAIRVLEVSSNTLIGIHSNDNSGRGACGIAAPVVKVPIGDGRYINSHLSTARILIGTLTGTYIPLAVDADGKAMSACGDSFLIP